MPSHFDNVTEAYRFAFQTLESARAARAPSLEHTGTGGDFEYSHLDAIEIMAAAKKHEPSPGMFELWFVPNAIVEAPSLSPPERRRLDKAIGLFTHDLCHKRFIDRCERPDKKKCRWK